VAGTMDALLPIDHHARAYARKVASASKQKHDDDDDDGDRSDKRPAYRLYEIQNGNHIETYQDTFPQLELTEPHARRALDLLVDQVERGRRLPPNQCVTRGGSISDTPAQPGHCASLFVP
jgi:DNA/RNA-binding domain of Phe-tRNA-synthetase-like protein